MKNQKFPNPCSRCGVCCLSETCLIGQQVFGIDRHELCHALVFEGMGDGCVATCRLIPLVPTGDGCCIKARAYKNGQVMDFASLPPHEKSAVAEAIRLRGYISPVKIAMVKGEKRCLGKS